MMCNKILILYPKEFCSYSKFKRKVENILSKIESYEILFLEDYNNFINKFFEKYHKKKILLNNSIHEITHAIIFFDGNEFANEIELLKSSNIPLRIIKIDITRVINIDREDPSIYGDKYVYIGRNPHRKPNTPNWSNPYSMYDFQIGEEPPSRDEVIHQFAYGFERENLPTNLKKSDVLQLKGKVLGCHCKPLACHGDILANYLNSLDDGK